jgi:tetratricopeptide (TPR) repeat protein/tRNA A-37 threonylcarbamoyl transferase component Bud32
MVEAASSLAWPRMEGKRMSDRNPAESKESGPTSGTWSPNEPLDGRYQIDKQIAITDRCEIYLAKELQPPKDTVVVKRLKPDKVYDNDARARFEREVAALRQIRHPSVLSIYDARTSGENRYLVTEFADMGALKDHLGKQTNRKLKPFEALAIATSICQGLGVIHQRGIIHRDVKPGNIVLFSQPDGTILAKLADFSIAHVPKIFDDETLTKVGSLIGTPPYASPEQLSGEMTDARTDLYSWAIVFFEMLTGESPIESLKDPVTCLPRAEIFTPTFFADRGVPRELVEVLQKALHGNRDLRYQSAEEVLESLASARSQIVVDIGRHLEEGEALAVAREWRTARATFERGIALCEWYGGLPELRDKVKELAHRLKMGHLFTRGMTHVAERRWQEAVEDLEQLHALDPHYLGMDISAELRSARSELQLEQKYQQILDYKKREDWTQVLRLAVDLTSDYKNKPGSDSIATIRKLALYARGKKLTDSGELDRAYDQIHRLYEEDPNYEDVARLCTTVAYRNAMREDIPLKWEHKVKWLERVIEIDPNHREGRTRAFLNQARHRWAEELLSERE